MHKKQKSIYKSVSRDIMALHTIRIQVFYTYQRGVVFSHYASSKLQVRFNRAMNEAVSATNKLLTSLQELKHNLSVA
ncbi:hypothetical protein FGIG_01398 [Fasciola gigantica]|uniref:Uncharacterized protein n=1 Tax=Fasciola gigantica TaxID=46835 RepID=A0A504YUR5_FASGI|nr:hypothetical protein FGIG_01398 [Fasciola gigantica]